MAEPIVEVPATGEVLKGRRVLVVDDDEMVSGILSKIFGRKGALVEIANGGDEALRKINENGQKPDLILTDNLMPNMTGPELIKKLREDPQMQDTPIILMSGDLYVGMEDNEREIQEKALSFQANAGMVKPCNISLPIKIAEQLLSAKQS